MSDRPLHERLGSTARAGYDAALDQLERVIPLARAIATSVLVYAGLVALAASVLAASLWILWQPDSAAAWVLFGFVAVALLAPVAILLVFYLVLREALAIPDKLRAFPDAASQRGGELARLAAEARTPEREPTIRRLPQNSWRVGRLLAQLRSDLPWASALLALVRVPFLIAVAASFMAGLAQLLAAPSILLVAVVLAAL